VIDKVKYQGLTHLRHIVTSEEQDRSVMNGMGMEVASEEGKNSMN